MFKDSACRYIVIDDDPIVTTISRRQLGTYLGDVDILTFNDPIRGLECLTNGLRPDNGISVVFLDINMPVMNAWELLDEFALLPRNVKDHIRIYIVSSSIDGKDESRANAHPDVMKFISKPLNRELIQHIALVNCAS